MRNAKDYGFLPNAKPKQNALALQQAVKDGGTVFVTEPGVYDIDGTVILKGDTSLIFGTGVSIKRITSKEDRKTSYLFVNEGAYKRVYDENIRIKGLHLICNGAGDYGFQRDIIGLAGHLAFFYVKNLVLEDIKCYDLPAHGFCIHVCTFEDIRIENIHIEGDKDAVHLGKGKRFLIRHGLFRTFDDPIALNAHDYSTSNPQLGWIEDGIIEDCYDLNYDSTTGFFCRILAGSWVDWYQGMQVQNSDTVVSEGRIYRVVMKADGAVYTSHTRPVHKHGIEVLDDICWVMVQEGSEYNCGCRNIVFRDIFLKKNRPVAFSIHFDKDKWSRSCYPGSIPPVQQNLIFDNIIMDGQIDTLLLAHTPVDTVKLLNSTLRGGNIRLLSSKAEDAQYGKTHILLNGTTFLDNGKQTLLECDADRSAVLTIDNSIVTGKDYVATLSGEVHVVKSDIPILQKEKD